MNEDTTKQTSVAKIETKGSPVRMGSNGIMLADFDALWKFGSMIARSGLAPKGIATPDAICVAIQMGMEIGLPPLASLQNIAVINGRPALWGDAVLGVCRASGDVEEFSEWFEQDGKKIDRNPSKYTDTTTAVCRVKRRGDLEPKEVAFSVLDAKRANLWDDRPTIVNRDGQKMANPAPWYCYPFRMLQFRARSFALRDKFGDALRGMKMAEDLQGGQIIDIQSEAIHPTSFTPHPPQIFDSERIVQRAAAQQPPESSQLPTEPTKRGPGRPKSKVATEEPKEPIGPPPEAEPEGTEGSVPEPPAPAQEETTCGIQTPQQSLANKVTEAGFSWDELVDWNAEMQFVQADLTSVPGFDDLPTTHAMKLLGSIIGLLKQLKARRALKGGK